MDAPPAPPLWALIIALVCAVCLGLAWRRVRLFEDLPTRFAILAVWLRLSVAAVPAFAEPALGPMSVAAVTSIVIALAGLALVDLRLFQLRYAFPIYGLIALIFLSGLMNGLYVDMIDFVVRYLYMVSLALLLFRGIRIYGVDPVLRALLCALSPVIILQYASIPLGIVKIGKEDGSLSYIATYFHEGPYSQLALGFMVVASLIRWRNPWNGALLIGAGLASVVLSNYRTTILGALPILAVGVAMTVRRILPFPVRAMLAPIGLATASGLVLFHDALLPARFADIGRVGDVLALAFEPPILFTRADRDLFNYRVFLWSNYLHRYFESGLVQQLIGFGPASWQYTGFFKTMYAHNTMLSWLYQFGVVGFGAMMATLGYNLWLTATGHDRAFALRLTACVGGYYLLSLAAEPLYTMEGVLIHGILFGVAWGMQAPEPLASPPPAFAATRLRLDRQAAVEARPAAA